MQIPDDYTERVYAGVLGKIIGVYLGRPIEGWSYPQITERFGEIDRYVHTDLGAPLVVADDDISGTFTFLRALEDYGASRDLTAEQIGQTWLNYLVEERTVLWWGGMGNSTEHTAYLRLKSGHRAPESGSIALNGQVVAEQIGAQIFIDGWGMVCPGDPELAAEFARKAASVSHDGEAIYAAQVVAAMEALAFVEADVERLLDGALALIPASSLVARMIADIREWHATTPNWRETRLRIVERYGYDKYGGNCHVIPNHALIILALLYGKGDFRESLMIVNTCGWDTDCNSGNVGCILGIRGGLAALDGPPDWRGPVADRLYLPTADGGRAITDAVQEAVRIANLGRQLAGQPSLSPKDGARFHFNLPGSVQGFALECGLADALNGKAESVDGNGCLAISGFAPQPESTVLVTTPTFLPPEALKSGGYSLMASPTLYPGETVRARVLADSSNGAPVAVRLALSYYGEGDQLTLAFGPPQPLPAGDGAILEWRIPELGGAPIANVGLEIKSAHQGKYAIYLDWLTWNHHPEVVLQPVSEATIWRRAWVDDVDVLHQEGDGYRIIRNSGRGLISQGTREWQDYALSAEITPHMAAAAGIAARVQGLMRYYALLLAPGGRLKLVKMLDGETTLAEAPFDWQLGQSYRLNLTVTGPRITATAQSLSAAREAKALSVVDSARPLRSGAVGIVCEEGRIAARAIAMSAKSHKP